MADRVASTHQSGAVIKASIKSALAYLRENKWVLDCGVKEIEQVRERRWPRRPIRKVTAYEVWYKWSADDQWHMVKYELHKEGEWSSSEAP